MEQSRQDHRSVSDKQQLLDPHLSLISLCVQHRSLHHPGHRVSLLYLHRLLLRALHAHFLHLWTVRRHILTHHLPCDLVQNESRQVLLKRSKLSVKLQSFNCVFKCFLLSSPPCCRAHLCTSPLWWSVVGCLANDLPERHKTRAVSSCQVNWTEQSFHFRQLHLNLTFKNQPVYKMF